MEPLRHALRRILGMFAVFCCISEGGRRAGSALLDTLSVPAAKYSRAYKSSNKLIKKIMRMLSCCAIEKQDLAMGKYMQKWRMKASLVAGRRPYR